MADHLPENQLLVTGWTSSNLLRYDDGTGRADRRRIRPRRQSLRLEHQHEQRPTVQRNDRGLYRFATPDPGLVGQNSFFETTDADPGDRVIFIYGRDPGTVAVPGCEFMTVQILQPRLIRVATAGIDGVATLDLFVPNAASGKTVLLQSLVRGRCVKSNVAKHTFQ